MTNQMMGAFSVDKEPVDFVLGCSEVLAIREFEELHVFCGTRAPLCGKGWCMVVYMCVCVCSCGIR